jgi:NADH-quinone oxidoreductase subunit N
MGFAAVFNVFLVGLVGAKANWQLAIAILAAASMTFGNLVALQQTNIRRMLAYSSIAQAGYVLIALVVSTSAQDGGVYAVGGGIFHLLTNAAMKLGAFLVVGALLYAGIPDQVDGVRGLGKRAPLLAFAMAVFLLSMAGLPPFGGFASKFVLFSSAVDVGVTQDLGWLIVLAVVAVVNSAISLFYYLRVIRAMYVDTNADETRIEVDTGVTVAVGLCLLAVLAMGIYPEPFVDASMKAARSLLGLA